MTETDGIEESFEGMVRVAVTAGARFSEELSRTIEQMKRQREAEARQEARDLRDRFEAERSAAVTDVRQVHSREWWDQASPERIGQTYATARAWGQHDPDARAAEERMSTELRDRYGIDVNTVDADPARVQEQLARYEAERLQHEADEQRRKEQEDRDEAARTMSEADRLDHQAQQAAAAAEFEPDTAERERAAHDADELHAQAADARSDAARDYDSAEQRGARAAALEQREGIDHATAQTRMRADVSQGRPAREAVATKKAAKARKGNTAAGPARQQQLGR